MKPGQTPALTPETIWAGKLLKLSLIFGLLQMAFLFGARQVLLSNLQLSRSIHDYFARAGEFTPALRRLKAFYTKPIDGIEFSQVFAVYLVICFSLIVFLLVVAVAAASSVFKFDRYRGRDLSVHLLPLIVSGVSLGTFAAFLLFGPLSIHTRSLLFNQDFITSMCMLVPIAQFLALVALIVWFVAKVSTRTDAPSINEHKLM